MDTFIRRVLRHLISISISITLSTALHATTSDKLFFRYRNFSISIIDAQRHEAIITLSGTAGVAGDIIADLSGPKDGGSFSIEGNSRQSRPVRADEPVTLQWRVHLPGTGYYHLADVGLRFVPNDARSREQYAGEVFYPLYADIQADGRVTASTQIDPAHCRPPVFIDRSAEAGKRRDGRHLAGDYNFTITGRVVYNIPGSTIFEAVPGVRVFIDWDEDDNPSTIYNPYDDDNTHHTWAVTNHDGYYSFNRHGSSVPLTLYGHRLRITAERANEATYNEILGPNAPFPDSVMIDLGGSTTDANLTAPDLVVDDYAQARLLRNIWRAREFARVNLNRAMDTLPFLHSNAIDAGGFFLQKGNFVKDSHGNTVIPAKSYSRFVYSDNLGSLFAYHEYGHYVESDVETIPTYPLWPNYPIHSWNNVINKQEAWVEGWAEFYAAAATVYWNRQDHPLLREDEGPKPVNYYPDHKLDLPGFIDDLLIPPTHDSVEGATATFLYDIWDDPAQRGMGTPLYTGDNEDLGMPRG